MIVVLCFLRQMQGIAELFSVRMWSNKYVSRRDQSTYQKEQEWKLCQWRLLKRHSISHTSSRRLGHRIARDQTYTLTEEDEFLIMRCEGIWDVLTSQEEVTELALEASRLNTFDNVLVVVVCFLSADEMVTRLLRRRSNGVVVWLQKPFRAWGSYRIVV